MMKALQKLQKSMDRETQQRASVALDMLIEYQQEQGSYYDHDK
jgi:squalene cyclase